MAPSPQAISEASVDALANDVRYVVDNMESSEWPRLAGDVLAHHEPPIEEALLSIKAAKLQHWCREMLHAMVDVDEDRVRAAARMVSRYS